MSKLFYEYPDMTLGQVCEKCRKQKKATLAYRDEYNKYLCDECFTTVELCITCKAPKLSRGDDYNHIPFIAQGNCFSCYHFLPVLAKMDNSKGTYHVIVDDEWEVMQFDTSKPKGEGCGGRPFTIYFTDGRVRYTNNMWCSGTLPEQYRYKQSHPQEGIRVRPNAEVIDGHDCKMKDARPIAFRHDDGRVLCKPCAESGKHHTKPLGRIWATNMIPYSQVCHVCNVLILDGAKKSDGSGEPLCIFEWPVQPVVKQTFDKCEVDGCPNSATHTLNTGNRTYKYCEECYLENENE